MLCVIENVPALSVCQNLSMNYVVCSRWGNFPFVFNLLETYGGPISPFSFSAEPYWRMSCAGVSCLPQCECVCVCVAHRKHRGDVEVVGGGEGVPWFLHICVLHFSGCCFSVVREGYYPVSFFSLSHFLPYYAHNKGPEVHAHTHRNSQSHRKPDWYGRQLVSAVWVGCVILFHPLTWQQFCTGFSSLRAGPGSKNKNLASASVPFRMPSLVFLAKI